MPTASQPPTMPAVEFVAALFALGLLRLALATWRQGRGVATAGRRLFVALQLAALITVPALPVLALGWSLFRGAGVAETEVVDERGQFVGWEPYDPPADGRPDVAIVFLLWLVLVRGATQMLRLPKRLRHLQRLPPVADPALAARIRELAAQLGLRPPQVVEIATTGGTMDVHAFTGGMLAPVVVVSDGVVHRLSARERDAVLAHELAHLRRRSVLRFLAVHVLAATAAVLLSGWVPLYVAAVWFVAMLAFVRALLGHREEVQADLAAGRCIGFHTVAAALDKTHASNLQARTGPWFHAVLSHPALAVRAFHLARAAPATERAHIAVDDTLARRCIRARRLALALWAALLTAVAVLGTFPGLAVTATLLGLPLLVVPLLPYLAFVRELREALQLSAGPLRLARRLLVRVALVAAAIAALQLTKLTPDDSVLVWLPIVLAALLVALAVTWGWRERRARRELELLLHQRDLAGWLERSRSLRPRWRRRPGHRLMEALVRAALGEREPAVDELLRLRVERPRFRLATLWAASLLARVDPPRAVALARQLLTEIPGNTAAEGTLVGALRRAGALDEAWERIQRLLHARSRMGEWHAAAARIELARGDRTAAAAALALAERQAPGDTATVLARAEFDVATDTVAAARSLARLRALDQRLPLAFVGDDLARLEREFAARGPAVG